MNDKKEILIIGGGSTGRNIARMLVNQSIFSALYSVRVTDLDLEAEIHGKNYDKCIVDDFAYRINSYEPVACEPYYIEPKSQKPWKAGYIPQHNVGPSYFPSALLLSLVDRVK